MLDLLAADMRENYFFFIEWFSYVRLTGSVQETYKIELGDILFGSSIYHAYIKTEIYICAEIRHAHSSYPR